MKYIAYKIHYERDDKRGEDVQQVCFECAVRAVVDQVRRQEERITGVHPYFETYEPMECEQCRQYITADGIGL